MGGTSQKKMTRDCIYADRNQTVGRISSAKDTELEVLGIPSKRRNVRVLGARSRELCLTDSEGLCMKDGSRLRVRCFKHLEESPWAGRILLTKKVLTTGQRAQSSSSHQSPRCYRT